MRRLCGLALLSACGGHPIEEPTLELRGPLRVAVDAYGPVQGPVAQLSDGSSPVSLRWTVEDPGVAQVDAEGIVSAIGPGTSVVSGRWKEERVSWTLVVEPLLSLRFEHPPTNAEVGEQVELTVLGFYQEVPVEVSPRWTSSDPTTATVSEAGIVTGRRTGIVYITAEVGGAEAMLELVVVPTSATLELRE